MFKMTQKLSAYVSKFATWKKDAIQKTEDKIKKDLKLERVEATCFHKKAEHKKGIIKLLLTGIIDHEDSRVTPKPIFETSNGIALTHLLFPPVYRTSTKQRRLRILQALDKTKKKQYFSRE